MKIPNKNMQNAAKDPKAAVKSAAKGYVKKAIIGFIISNFGVIISVVVIAAVVVAMLAPLMPLFSAFSGLFGSKDKVYLQQQLGSSYDNGKSLKDILTQYLDCSHASKQDVAQHFCIDQTEFAESSPIPADKQWLVPIWQAAGAKYNVRWELLAAISAARTNFGDVNCSDSKGKLGGVGFYRLDPSIWDRNKEDMGGATLTTISPPSEISYKVTCYGASMPATGKWQKKDGEANPYDPVDASFALAKYLGNGMGKDGIPDWSYSGAEAGSCNTPDSDGVYFPYVPAAGAIGGDAGWNEKVHLSQEALAIGQQHTMAQWLGGTYPPAPGVPGEVPYPDYHNVKQGYVPVPQEKILIDAAGRAIGLPDNIIAQIRPGLLGRISQESGGFANTVQGIIAGDPNNAFPDRARGIFQFVPGTWNGTHIPGYNNIYNPAHNILAAVSGMRWSTSIPVSMDSINLGPWGSYAIGGTHGWRPTGGNPYASTQGRYNGGSGAKAATTGKYLGTKIDDTLSKILETIGASKTPASPCSIATIHDWYQAIVANPPNDTFSTAGGGRLGKMIAAAMHQKGVVENPKGSNGGGMVDVFEKSVGVGHVFWCATFVSWAAQQAGIPVLDNGMGSARVEDFYTWANEPSVNLWADRGSITKPNPGDIVVFGSHSQNSSYAHIGIVINSGSPASNTFYTIEGNAGDAVSVEPRSMVPSGDEWVNGFVRLSKRYGQVPGDPTVVNPLDGFLPTQPIKTN